MLLHVLCLCVECTYHYAQVNTHVRRITRLEFTINEVLLKSCQITFTTFHFDCAQGIPTKSHVLVRSRLIWRNRKCFYLQTHQVTTYPANQKAIKQTLKAWKGVHQAMYKPVFKIDKKPPFDNRKQFKPM